MENRVVLVVGETPSIGRALVDLLKTENVPCRFVDDVDSERPLSHLSERVAVVVAACNEQICSTARRWARGEIPNVPLVVVGSRDPTLISLTGARIVPLPLVPRPFLALTTELLAAAGPARDAPGSRGTTVPPRLP